MILTIFIIVTLIMSAVVHEVAHGWTAYRLGDNTAKDLGRLTLNPIKHLDPVGSVLVPIIMTLLPGNFFIAWAKPVPYNPYNLRDRENDELKVALAGPASNLLIVIAFGILALILPVTQEIKASILNAYMSGANDLALSVISGSLTNSLYLMSFIICLVNVILMVFNLIPVPPLDGSKVLMRFLPETGKQLFYRFETYGFLLLLILVYFDVVSIVITPIIAIILSIFF